MSGRRLPPGDWTVRTLRGRCGCDPYQRPPARCIPALPSHDPIPRCRTRQKTPPSVVTRVARWVVATAAAWG